VSSEKSRYLNRNRGPTPPLHLDDLPNHLAILGSDRLAELVWVRAQEDDVLRKALMTAVAIRVHCQDWEPIKAAINYALHFPEFVRYTESGHGQILDEIRNALEFLVHQGKRELALRAAQHAITLGNEVTENFEDDWDWTNSLNELTRWVDEQLKIGV
jgi:hypothetical protein